MLTITCEVSDIKEEEKRAEVVRDLDIQIENLSHKLNSLRTAHIRQP